MQGTAVPKPRPGDDEGTGARGIPDPFGGAGGEASLPGRGVSPTLLGVQGAKPPCRGLGCPQQFPFF